MDIKFSKDSAGNQQDAAEGKGKQNALLIVLLVLLGGFAYIYFFTGLIRPVEEEKTAEAPPAVSQVTKKALPAVDGAPVKADSGAEVNKAAAVPAVKPAPAPVAPAIAPAPVAAAKPVAQETARAKEEQKPPAEALPSVKKPLPAVGKADVKKPAPPEKKETVAAEKKPQPAKEMEKKPAEVKKPVEKKQAAAVVAAGSKKEVQKPAGKATAITGNVASSGLWTVLVGNYVLEELLATDLARVRKAGLEAYVIPAAKKKSHMNRLFLAEYTDRDSAQAELTKLKRITSDAFIIDNAGMHSVYAGSYLLDARAGSEKERLAAAGFKLVVRRVDVLIPSKNLTAGSFAEKGAAEEALKKLKAAGVKASLSRQ